MAQITQHRSTAQSCARYCRKEASAFKPRRSFAAKKTLAHPECQVCEYQSICHGGCPKFRHSPHRRFEDLDYFCQAYKMIYAKAVGPLRREVEKLLGRAAVSPY